VLTCTNKINEIHLIVDFEFFYLDILLSKIKRKDEHGSRSYHYDFVVGGRGQCLPAPWVIRSRFLSSPGGRAVWLTARTHAQAAGGGGGEHRLLAAHA
jgi:hypothetical protein